VPVRVDHAGHDDAAPGVDLLGALGHRQVVADGGDPLAVDEDVGIGEHRAGVVHRENRAGSENHAHGETPLSRTIVRMAVTGSDG
jgi:hypothetical protein